MQVVATAGHVDHGKSTLLRALTGMEPDRWAEEQRRGLTIDLGFVWSEFATPDGGTTTVAFVDVPGHEKFIANMLAGAGAVRLAMFVVAADDGWSAQSQEHLEILDLLGVGGAVAVITKSALAGEERTAEVASDVGVRFNGTSLAGTPVIAVDGITGAGIDRLRAMLTKRLALAGAIPDTDRARLWVDRAFTVSGAGTVVTGTLQGGSLAAGDEVVLRPSGRTGRVRGLQSLGSTVERAEVGARVAVNLAGLDRDEVRRGEALVHARTPWLTTDTVDAWVRALPGRDVRRKGAWHLHAGSADVACTVHPLLGEPVRDGGPAFVRIVLDTPLPLTSGDRLVLRDGGRRATAGGGTVIDPIPVGRVRGIDARIARVDALTLIRDVARPARAAALAAAHGGAVNATRLRAAVAADPSAIPAGCALVGDDLVTFDALGTWSAEVLAATHRHHDVAPEDAGAPRAALVAAAVAAGCPRDALAVAVLDHLISEGELRRTETSYALADFTPSRDEALGGRREQLLAALLAEPFSPPPLDDISKPLGMNHMEINTMIQAGELVRCGPITFARVAVDAATAALRELAATVGPFSASQARETLGTSRKYVIPLLEHLDRTGVTRFDGSQRTVT